jgi:hypothetical protein
VARGGWSEHGEWWGKEVVLKRGDRRGVGDGGADGVSGTV